MGTAGGRQKNLYRPQKSGALVIFTAAEPDFTKIGDGRDGKIPTSSVHEEKNETKEYHFSEKKKKVV